MLPEHIKLGRNKWRVTIKREIEDKCVCKKKLAKKLRINVNAFYKILQGFTYPTKANFDKINSFFNLNEERYFYFRKKRSDAKKIYNALQGSR